MYRQHVENPTRLELKAAVNALGLESSVLLVILLSFSG